MTMAMAMAISMATIMAMATTPKISAAPSKSIFESTPYRHGIDMGPKKLKLKIACHPELFGPPRHKKSFLIPY